MKGQGVFVTFDMPENPAARQLTHGELHLKWKNASTSGRPRTVTTTVSSAASAGLSRESSSNLAPGRSGEENDSLESYYARI